MGPHPDLVYKRNGSTVTCQFREELIAAAFLTDDGQWELTAIDQQPTLHVTRSDAVLALQAWARRYAWWLTTVH